MSSPEPRMPAKVKATSRPAGRIATRVASKVASQPASQPAPIRKRSAALPETRKTTSTAPPRATKNALPVPPAKPKQKLVRDSFTIPKPEYAVLQNLKARAAALKRPIKKSELLRAGIAALNGMPDKTFLAALNAVPSLKTGRPVRSESLP